MALNFLELFSKFSRLQISSNTVFKKTNILGSSIQFRDRHGLWKDRTKHDNYWVPRKRPYTDDKLTHENKEFLQEIISERFLKPEASPLKELDQDLERPIWTPQSKRCGLIARKIGIYPMWMKDGRRIQTTLLQVVDNHVIRYNSPEVFAASKYAKTVKEKGTFGSLVVGSESADPQMFTKAYGNLFAEAGVMPKRKLTRFRITPDAAIAPGTPLFATHFKVGQYVNVFGITRYHGFQGVMKRWNFKGGPASRGCNKSHRRPGCLYGGWKNHIWKGKKMPGLHGGWRRLVPCLKVVRINTKYNILYIRGISVPGVTNNYCYISDCRGSPKKDFDVNDPPLFPTYYPGDIPDLPEEIFDKEMHDFADPSVVVTDPEMDVKRKTKVKHKKK